MRQFGVLDHYTCPIEPFLQGASERYAYLLDAATQGDVRAPALHVVRIVIRVSARQMANRCVTLDADVLLIFLHLKARPRGIVHSPHDRSGDLDGIAALVVDLDLITVETVGA